MEYAFMVAGLVLGVVGFGRAINPPPVPPPPSLPMAPEIVWDIMRPAAAWIAEAEAEAVREYERETIAYPANASPVVVVCTP